MNDTTVVNNLFSKDEIDTLRKLVGLCLVNVQVQKPSVCLPPNGYIEGMGTVALNFSGPTGSLVVVLESLYEEHVELGDIGGIKILHSFTGLWTAGESLKSNFDIRGRDSVSFTYPVPPKVSSISCFGREGRGKLSDHGFGDAASPDDGNKGLIVDTIEFIVMEMSDLSKVVLQSSSGGFFCFFEPAESDVVNRFKEAYEDEIVLQYAIETSTNSKNENT